MRCAPQSGSAHAVSLAGSRADIDIPDFSLATGKPSNHPWPSSHVMVRFKNRYMLFEVCWKDGRFDDTISESRRPTRHA